MEVAKRVVYVYRYLNNEISDPRVEDWFMMSSPFPSIFLVLGYFYLVKNLGPKLMKNRQPFNITKISALYDVSQVLICAWLLKEAYKTGILQQYNLFCQPVDYSNSENAIRIARLTWCYYLLKIFDMLDTIFFVLRKKNEHLSFLHLYHHAGMVLLIYIGTKYVPGGQSLYLGLINLVVHIIMYTYYFLTAYDSNLKKSLWWKKHITQLQILQFFLLTCIFASSLFYPNCSFPKVVSGFMIPQAFFMFCLFADFYRKAYSNPSEKTS